MRRGCIYSQKEERHTMSTLNFLHLHQVNSLENFPLSIQIANWKSKSNSSHSDEVEAYLNNKLEIFIPSILNIHDIRCLEWWYSVQPWKIYLIFHLTYFSLLFRVEIQCERKFQTQIQLFARRKEIINEWKI